VHPDGDTSDIKHIRWGAFSMICAKTYKFPLERKRSALVGLVQSPQLPCLYLPGNSGGLKITGETRLEGKVIVPNAQVERAYIAGKNYPFSELVFGTTEKAELGLPPLREEWSNLSPADLTKGLKPLPYTPRDSTYSFFQTTTYYQQLAPVVIGQSIRGNVIIHSFDSIYVEARAHLHNVILIAPIVRFQTGFHGTVQVLATERVVCEPKTQLLYPSVLALNELPERNELTRRAIIVSEEAQVLGGVLMTSQRIDFRKMPLLELREKSVVGGLIYNMGESEPKGTIIGSLYTSQIMIRAGGGVYGNHLVDALISTKRLPEYFLLPGWLKEQEKVAPKLLAWL
jgi:hypothetical protein